MLKKKILLAIHSLQAGGMERVMAELTNCFSENSKIEVHLIIYGSKREVFYPIAKNVIIHKPIFEFNNERRLISTLKTLFFLRKKFKKINPDIILSFGEFWNNLVLIATIGLKYPVYIADRSEPLMNLGAFHNNLRKLLYNNATGLILQTQQAKKIYQKQFKKLNITVIGNPIRDIKNNNNIQRKNIILMVGRLVKTKHQDRLIKIFAKINIPDWKLVLVGYDHIKQKNSISLAKLIRELQLENRVILAGKQMNVEDYYLKSKIFAFTSDSEGFPNVIGEAMSAGLPVVAYDCIAGPSEIINDSEDGFLIPLFDDKFFQLKLNELMENDNLRQQMGENARNNIKKFNKDLIAEKFLEFILSHKKH